MSVTPSDLLADLPDPRDDEPSSLRSDIAEELTDHLVCSVRREMVKGADEPTAWERALKRFGDPRQIARKLWWLAMRRRIMNQRLMLGLQGAMLLAVIAVAAAMIQMSNAQQRQMAQQQEVLTAVLAKLGKRLEEPATPVTVPDATLTVEVQYARPDEPRRSGESAEYTVSLRGVDISNEAIKAERPCDPKTGIVSFGTLPPGGYEVWVNVQSGMLRAVRRIEVERREQHREVFAEPPLRVRDETVTLGVDVPTDFRAALDDQHLAVLLDLTPEPVSFHDQDWELERPLRLIWTPERTLTTWSTLDISPEDLHREVVRKNVLEGIGNNGASWPEEDGFKPHQFSRRKGARFHLKTVGIIANPFRGGKSGGEGQLYMSEPVRTSIAVMLDSTSADWPAEFNAVFVAEADKPWRVTLPPALIAAARAQLAELAAHPPLPGQLVAGNPASAIADPKHNRVQVRVVEEDKSGPVIKSAEVTLNQPAWAKPLSPAVGNDGSLDFGYLDAGLYTLTTALTWGPTEKRQFVVHPGRSHLEVVVAPAAPKTSIEVPVRIPLTEELRKANVAIGLFPVMVAASGSFPDWKTRQGVKVFRTQTPDGRTVAPDPYRPTIALTNWDGKSLTAVMTLLPGTYGLYEIVVATKDESSIQRVTLTFDEDDLRRKVLAESGDEWRIELPEDVLKELPDALRQANSRAGEPLRIRVAPEQHGE